MAAGAAISPEQLDELCNENLFNDALGRWLADGAVTWNTWQKGFAAIRARYLEKDPEAAGPVEVACSTWCQRVWCELSEEAHGPEWRRQLKVGRTTPRLPQSGTPHFGLGSSALVATTRGMPPPTSKAGGAPAPKSSWKSGLWGLLERGSRALREAEAASALARCMFTADRSRWSFRWRFRGR